MPKKPRISAKHTPYTEKEEALLLEEVQHAVHDLFVKTRRLWGKPVTFDEIEDAYCARDPKRRLGYPDNLVDVVQSWIIENTNAENEHDRLFFVDESCTVLDRWHINEHAIPDEVRERRKVRRPVPCDSNQPRPARKWKVIQPARWS
jgi:hypothetical protein